MRQMPHDEEEDPNSEEDDSCAEESDLTTAFEREMDDLASLVEELGDTLDVQDVEDLRELADPMYEGLATTKNKHTQRGGRKHGIAVSIPANMITYRFLRA